MTDFLSRLGPLALYALGFSAWTLLLFVIYRAIYRHANRFAPAYFPGAIPVLFLTYLLLGFLYGRSHAANFYFPNLLRVLAAMIVYYALLWALTPLLRKRVSADGCATLWLLPNLLFFVSQYLLRYNAFVGPLFVVRLPHSILRIALGVWAAGFAAVLGWKIVSHFRFRKAVLRDAVPVSAQERDLFLSTWRALCFEGNVRPAGFKGSMKTGGRLTVLRSPAVDCPLTVGLLEKKCCLVLPQRDYSEQELWLIFRHESIHLLRLDNWLKFSLSFLCALGWFIPMVWLGLQKASEDMELCCDELTTKGMQEARRRDYANLLLSGAGTAMGFTTCLSASASGLRYRMARILHPKKRRAGFLSVFLLSVFFFILFGTSGVIVD